MHSAAQRACVRMIYDQRHSMLAVTHHSVGLAAASCKMYILKGVMTVSFCKFGGIHTVSKQMLCTATNWSVVQNMSICWC